MSCTLRSSFFLLLVLGFAPSIPPAQAQDSAGGTEQQSSLEPGHLTLQAEALRDGGTIVLGNKPWRYHPGDDLGWADPLLDETAWRLLEPDFKPDSLDEDTWSGIGWFRLHLTVAPGLRNTTLALHPFHLGASEIYLDGEKVGGFGEVGTSATEEQPFNPKGLPIGLHLDDQAEHVLAVRYSYQRRDARLARVPDRYPRHAEGFFMLVKPINGGIQAFIYQTMSAPFTTGLIIGVLLLLGGLHLLLYGLDPQERANLYFSVLAFSGAVAIYLIAALDSPAPIIPDIGSGLKPGGLAFWIMSLATLAVFHQIFYRRLLLIFWIVAASYLVAFVLSFFFVRLNTDLPGYLRLLVILEGIRVTGLAIWKKKEGGWILGSGIVIPFLTGFFLNMIADQFVSPQRARLLDGAGEVTILPNLFEVGIIVVYLSIPVAMSVLLARRFSQTSRKLRAKLKEVQALSAQTLAQEREKQALIATQNERLEDEVAERTVELKANNETLKQTLTELRTTQAQLVQQEKMASLGQLTAGIAHEIKNPLNFINNFAEVNIEVADELREAWQNGEDLEEVIADLKRNAQVIAQHGKRADGIVQSMMAHARESKGEREAVNLNALIDEHVDLAYHGKRAQQTGFACQIERDYDEAAGRVEVVPQEIGRVLLNLLSNAFDAVHEYALQVDGAYIPEVTVQTQQIDGQVEIRISDNGSGISPEIKDRIFEPFFTTKPTGSGTGLGLSLSYDIVTQGHGGTLTVESIEGEGATFVITLPNSLS